MTVTMIIIKRNRKFSFELQSSHVIEKRYKLSSFTWHSKPLERSLKLDQMSLTVLLAYINSKPSTKLYINVDISKIESASILCDPRKYFK